MMKTLIASLKRIFRHRLLIVTAALLATYFAFAYLAVDPLARWLLPKVAESQLASRLQLERVQFDPLRLMVTVNGLRLTKLNGAPLASFEQLVVDLETSGLARWAWRFRDIRLSAPQVSLDIAPDGTLNWAELIARLNEEEDEPSDTLPRILIEHILIERGHVQYQERNRPTPFMAALQPLGLELDGLSTLPEDRGEYSILARLPEQGGTLKWKGDIALNPLASTGAVEVKNVKLAKLLSIIKAEALPIKAAEGEVATRYSYRFAMVKGEPQDYPRVQIDNFGLTLDHVAADLQAGSSTQARLQAEQVQVSLPALEFSMRNGTQLQFHGMALALQQLALARQGDSLFRLQQAEITGIDFDLAANKLKVADALFRQGAINSRRDKDGNSDWQQLATALAAGPTPDTAQQENAADQPTTAAAPLGFAIDHVRLEQWQLRHQDAAFLHPLDLTAGKINLAFALDNTAGAPAVQAFNSEIAELGVKSSLYPQPVATLASVHLQDGMVNVKDNSASLAGVVLSGLQTQVLRPAGKPLNWQSILETPPAAKAVANTKPASGDATWKFSLGKLALENAAVHVEDHTTPKPVLIDIKAGTIELQQPSLDLAKPLPLKARLQVKQGGALEVAGKLTAQPLKADLQVKLSGLALKPFSPLLNQVALLKLDGGRLDVGGKLALDARKTLQGSFRGSFSVRQLAISEEASGAPFLAWKEVSSESIKLTLSPNRLHVDELRVLQPTGKFIIHEDGSMNIQRILRTPATTAQAAPAASTPREEGFPVAIDRVSIADADLEFADLTLRPQFGTHIAALSGVINGLSSNPATTAQVELDGKVDEFGSARIRGSIQPFQATDFTDLQLSFKNLEMNRLTPYSGKFAGRRIDSGKLSVDLQYKIKQRQLTGENKFVIHKLKLGERVESRDAMDLPLDLAIAVLEDSDGVIDLDLPISGSLDDPQFSYGKIIWKAITNVITKIVTAPFRALGKLLGADSEKLQAIGFDAGSPALAPQEQEKLKTLAEAMDKRPALFLTITPTYAAAADTAALQEQATRRDVLQETGLKLQTGEQPGPLDLNNTKVQSAIERLLKQRSGGGRGSKALDNIKDYFRKAKPEDLPKYSEMLAQLRLTVTVSEAELASLAKSRASAIQDYLVKTARLAEDRVSMAATVAANGDGKVINLGLTLGATATRSSTAR